MHKVSLTNKVFTENPLLDEIVYNARQLATGSIVKDQDLADSNETLESIQHGDILISIKNGNINFKNFHYDANFLSTIYPSATKEYLQELDEDNSKIPNLDKDRILRTACKSYIDNYYEYNSYYRMLHGLPTPKIDETTNVITWNGLWIDSSVINSDTKINMDYISSYEIEGYVLIHELDITYKNILYENGTCEYIVNNSKWLDYNDLTKDDVMYLMHIGDREVDFYDARVSDKFTLLYCPRCDSEEVKTRYKDLYEANRQYLLYTSYSEAYKYRSDYYNNFMIIFLIIQTIIDMIIELPEYIIRRDIFDTRTCKYIFESNGVKYFKDIPLKYQIALVKNLNKLIKFKSTDKCIVDIISLFGVENIQAFRYYIMKDRRINDNLKELEYYANTKEITDSIGNTDIVEDNDKNYDVRFIKVPLLEKYDEYIRTDANIRNYESITDGDKSWIGDKIYNDVLSGIKNLDFTVLRSKYYSIEAVIELSKKSFTIVYFMNMLMYNNIDKSSLKVNIPIISTGKKFDLVDIILMLYSLSYIYYGVEDTILDSRAKTAQILGFNLEADLAKISSWLYENHQELTMKDLKVDSFYVPKEGKIMSFNELQDMFLTNKDCYDYIRKVMHDPPSKEIYDAYRFLYKSLMITNRNMEYFVIHDRKIVDYYESKGYKSKFINIPQEYEYHNHDDYDRDYKWLVESIDDKDLCFNMNISFDENHLFDLYIKNNGILEYVGNSRMAYTYKDFLRYKDQSLYEYISNIIDIKDTDSRKEACVNAIQTIVSYLKDYIDDDTVNMDTVLSGLPSISLDFIKKYVEEVIDFFKSFKIFTHGSSIIYVMNDKYDNYIQLIDHILLKYLFDKSELIKIEDAIGAPISEINGRLIHKGHGIDTDISHKEKFDMIDKVWFDINTWIHKNYTEFYNSDVYKQTDSRIKDYAKRIDKYNFNSNAMEERYIKEIETESVDAIIRSIICIIESDKIKIKEKINSNYSHFFKDHYDRWITDILNILINKSMSDKMEYQDDYLRIDTYKFYSKYHIFDGSVNKNNSCTISSKLNIQDVCSTINIQQYPAHIFDE